MRRNDDDPSTPLVTSVLARPRKIDRRTPFQKKLALTSIIASAGFERLAFYSLAGNLTFFLTSSGIQWHFPNPIIASLIFLGSSYVSALFFSWLSDGKCGRRLTILIGFALYLIGYALFACVSNNEVRTKICGCFEDNLKIKANSSASEIHLYEEYCSAYLVSMLVITAIGVGGVQANTAVFGAEQVRKKESTTRYFDFYYAAVNIGALVAYGAIAYIQLNMGYFDGYMIATGLLVLSVLFYLMGYRFYYKVDPHKSVVSICIPMIINAIRTWYIVRNEQRRINKFNQSSNSQTISSSDRGDDSESLVYHLPGRSWSILDYAKVNNRGNFTEHEVEDVKGLGRVIGIFALLIPYWLLYFQIETTFIVQGAHMQLPAQFRKMPVIWLSLGNQIIIIVLIVFLNTFVYKRLAQSGRSLSIKTRILIGLVSAVIAMLLAGGIEVARYNIVQHNSFTQTIGNSNYTAANMSVFFQFPQYVAIGVSEVFASVASLEFAYLIAPTSAQSLIMSLRFSCAGISSFIGSLIIVLFHIQSDRETVSNGDGYRNDNIYFIYFFFLAGLQSVFILILLLCDHKYKIFRLPPNRYQSSLSIGSNASSSRR